jgi:hypothetical protein
MKIELDLYVYIKKNNEIVDIENESSLKKYFKKLNTFLLKYLNSKEISKFWKFDIINNNIDNIDFPDMTYLRIRFNWFVLHKKSNPITINNYIFEKIHLACKSQKLLSIFTKFNEWKLAAREPKTIYFEIKKYNGVEQTTNDLLVDMTILFSGFRDQELENKITVNGGIIKKSFIKQLNMLIVKDNSVENNKTSKANDLDIPVYTKQEFIEKYNI